MTSALTDSEVEGRTRLWRDAEVDLVVLSSLVSVNGSQNLDYLPHTNQNVTDIFMLTPFLYLQYPTIMVMIITDLPLESCPNCAVN